MDLLESAQRAAKLAAAYLRTAVPPSPEAWTAKGQNDFVTEVDRHAEEIIRGSLLIDSPNARRGSPRPTSGAPFPRPRITGP